MIVAHDAWVVISAVKMYLPKYLITSWVGEQNALEIVF